MKYRVECRDVPPEEAESAQRSGGSSNRRRGWVFTFAFPTGRPIPTGKESAIALKAELCLLRTATR
jgi:hypothetical protein